MKATGIVRRIDDLGRVVVPKEIRRTLRIREGDPLEIFTDREGALTFRRVIILGRVKCRSAVLALQLSYRRIEVELSAACFTIVLRHMLPPFSCHPHNSSPGAREQLHVDNRSAFILSIQIICYRCIIFWEHL